VKILSILAVVGMMQGLAFGATPAAAPKAPGMDIASTGNGLKVTEGALEFFAIGKPSMLKIHGESKAMTGELNRSGADVTGNFQIPLDSFTTGMGVRDTHLKEKIFEIKKFDKATLKITKLQIPGGKAGDYKGLDFTGTLNFHGVDKDIAGKADVTVTDTSIKFDTTAEVNLSDFKIDQPEFMGMTVQDKVKIEAKGEAK
jgi:polyisoprenoid-binding protein YceI